MIAIENTTEIADGIYAVKMGSLSGKRFNDAVALAKDQWEAKYDKVRKLWIIPIESDSHRARSALHALATTYGCTVSLLADDEVDISAADALRAERDQLVARLAEIDKRLAELEA